MAAAGRLPSRRCRYSRRRRSSWRRDRPMSAARDIIRELQALGAHLERDGDRMTLRAGRQPIPQLLVQRARDAKRELLALFDEPTALSPPTKNRHFPTTKKTVAALGENHD